MLASWTGQGGAGHVVACSGCFWKLQWVHLLDSVLLQSTAVSDMLVRSMLLKGNQN